MDQIFEFLGLEPRQTTLVRLLRGPSGSTTEVACPASEADRQRLLREARRENYLDRLYGPLQYQGCYLRPSHEVEPREWLDPRPRLGEKEAKRYRCFLIDIDADKAGDSATEQELQGARRCAEEVILWLGQDLDLSCALLIMSGNGYQLLIRAKLELEHQWLVRELLLRMRAMWRLIDPSGYKCTVGPAVPGTLKCKGYDQNLYREVRVAQSWQGSYRITPDDLIRLIDRLPKVNSPDRFVASHRPVVFDEWGAVAQLPISEVLLKVFGAEQCPACGAQDSAFAVISDNVCCCLHANRCPAASTDHRGFTAQHVYGIKLFNKWSGFTHMERNQIVEAALGDGFRLEIDPDIEAMQRARAIDNQFFGPPAIQACQEPRTEPETTPSAATSPGAARASRPLDIDPNNRWLLEGSSPSYQLCAELLRREITHHYCPSWDGPFVRSNPNQPLVFDGSTYCYDEQQGIFIKPLQVSGDASEIGEVSRIVQEVQRHGILYTDPSGKPRSMSVSSVPLLKEFEALCKSAGYMSRGPAGIACLDAFLAVEGGVLATRPHSPANRALGQLRISASEAMREKEASGAAGAAVVAFKALVRKLLSNHAPEDCDAIAQALLEQIGAALCRLRPEVRRGFIFNGPEDTGKSTLLRIADELFQRLGLPVGHYKLCDINSPKPPLGIATDVANICYELNIEKVRNTARLKQLVEGSPWTLERKYYDSITVQNSMLMLLAANGELTFEESSGALVKRFCVIDFPDHPPAVKDPELASRFLDAHLDGLALAAVVASLRLAGGGRTEMPTTRVLEDSEDVLREVCPVREWIETCCELTVASNTPLETAQESCILWLEHHGFRSAAAALNPRQFRSRLKRAGRKVRRSHSRYFTNLVISAPVQADPATDRL